MPVKIALIGLGYWGPSLARVLASIDGAELYALCDVRRERLAHVRRLYPKCRTTTNYETVLSDSQIDAVVIATPVCTHFDLAKQTLQAGKHVMVEKPMAQTTDQCRELIAIAEKNQLTLMVGHVFIYNPAVRMVKDIIRSGQLGQVYYIYSQRLNLGRVRQDVNAMWNFAPHDLSILCYWLGEEPARVSARGYSYILPGIEDVVFLTLDFPGNIGSNIHISWLDPRKVRRITVVGSEKMVVYDDVNSDGRIMVYDKGVSKKFIANDQDNHSSLSLGEFENFGEFQLLLRAGDVLIPKLDFSEPLKNEFEHFVQCVQTGQSPITDGYSAFKVVRILEAAQSSLRQNGVTVSLPPL